MSNIHTEIDQNDREIIRNSLQGIYNLDQKKSVQAPSSLYNVSDVSESAQCVRKVSEEVLTIEQGLDFMLAHFTEPLWPRNVSTAATNNGQKPVYDRDRAILFYQGALRQDCRLACYPNYEELAKSGAITPKYNPKPTHLFIDLDLATFAGDRQKLDLALKNTLRNIKRQLDGQPTVLWSGGGYHVHQPLESAAVPTCEELPEFRRYDDDDDDASVRFMRYAERVLTGHKGDRNHCVSFKSCMARIPGSRNSKYTGDIAEVRVVQSWDGVRARPTTQFMITDFLIWLVQAELDDRIRLQKQAKKYASTNSLTAPRRGASGEGIGWIEKLLQTPIDDYRKHARDLILVPYLVVRRGMTNVDQICDIVMQWADKCAELKGLEPTRREYEKEVRSRVYEVMRDRIPYMGLEKLREKNPALYEKLLVGGP